MDLIKEVWNWIVYSSKDPQKISLTLKGLIPLLVLLKVGDSIQLEGVADVVAHLVVLTSDWVFAVIAAYGLIRKMAHTTSSIIG